jgi:glycosyltransferase involved in cell wall biosynthesis
MTTAVSVVLPTFDRASLLALTLPRLLRQTLPAGRYEVVLVDDGSTDDTPAVAEAAACPALRHVRAVHGGRAAARNHALRAARGEVLVFLDDDAFVAPDFLAAHLAAHRGDDRRMATGPIVAVAAPPAGIVRPAPWRGYHRNPFPTGNASVRREHALRAGGFDEAMRLYGWEDVEFAARLADLGLRRRFVWSAPIFHLRPDVRLADDLARERERGTMGARFYRKHGTVRVGLATKMWWPFRALDAGLARLAALDRLSARVQDRPELAARLPGAVRVLLRHHAEISAGRRELARAAIEAQRGRGPVRSPGAGSSDRNAPPMSGQSTGSPK